MAVARPVDQPLVTPALLRNIVGQAAFQLGVMWVLVTRGDAVFGVPSHFSLGGAPSEHYTIVFNTFVLLQLFNQVRLDPSRLGSTTDAHAGSSRTPPLHVPASCLCSPQLDACTCMTRAAQLCNEPARLDSHDQSLHACTCCLCGVTVVVTDAASSAVRAAGECKENLRRAQCPDWHSQQQALRRHPRRRSHSAGAISSAV